MRLQGERISLGMPFLLRTIDGILFFLLRWAARYRFQVIRDNLSKAFNYSSQKDQIRAVTLFYWFLAKIIRQTIATPSKSLLTKRIDINQLPEIDGWLKEGKSVIIDMGHIGNWEWAGHYLGHTYPGNVCALYKKIKSVRLDQWMHRRRQLGVEYLVEVSRISDLVRLIREKPVLILMISDQNPGNDQGIIWSQFFGRDTAFVSGPETLALKYQLPVVYLNVMPRGRNGYSMKMEIISDGTTKMEGGKITDTYAKLLEQNIREYREGWLWSHRRWKRSRGQGAGSEEQ